MNRSSVMRRMTGILALGAAVTSAFLLTFGLGTFKVVGPSMEPALRNGEYIVVEKISYSRREPRKGEIIAFLDPRDGQQTYLKRLIAAPGDTVEVVQGSLLLNGKPVDEPYLAQAFLPDFSHPKLGDNQYFTLGDNRALSKDSRNFGPIARNDIIGRAWIVYSPPFNLRRAPSFIYPRTSPVP